VRCVLKDDDFHKVRQFDEPELVGAQWWRAAHLSAPDDQGWSRRSAIMGLAGLSALSAGLGTTTGCADPPPPPPPPDSTLHEQALELQRTYGWDFGNPTGGLRVAGKPGPLEAGSLERLVDDLKPKNPALQPYYGPVLFQCLSATPSSPETTSPRALKELIGPLETPEMITALRQGLGMSELFAGAPAGRAVVLDLPGPEAAAFAAGLADRFEPVFWFDKFRESPSPLPDRRVVPSGCPQI
jgi:hypothetical protein